MGKETVVCPLCGRNYYGDDECECCKEPEFADTPAKEIILRLLPPGNFNAYMRIYQAIKETLEAHPPKAPDAEVITDQLKSLKRNWERGYLSHERALTLQREYMEEVGRRVLPSTVLYFWLGLNKKGAQTDDFALGFLMFALMTDLKYWYRLRRMNKQYGTRAGLVSRFLKEEKIIEIESEAVEGRCKRFKLAHVSPVLAVCKYHLSTQGLSLAEDCPKNSIGFITLLYRDL